MGVSASAFDRHEEALVSWLVDHTGAQSTWVDFVARCYDGGAMAVTGMADSMAIPLLARTRLGDWSVRGLNIILGANSVSIGRHLASISTAGGEQFYGVDVLFGANARHASWFWSCGAAEWILRLHYAALETWPENEAAAPRRRRIVEARASEPPPGTTVQEQSDPWKGRPRYIGEEPTPPVRVDQKQAEEQSVETANTAPAKQPEKLQTQADAPVGQVGESTPGSSGASDVTHQLSMILSNADGHAGYLALPVVSSAVDEVAGVISAWEERCCEPLSWGGRCLRTKDDFREFLDSALNMPDLLLLALEPELARVLTPDNTWEKYPAGFGEPALSEQSTGQ
eukprot:TRINITY_DN39865_c0_g1_i1.p1 TRINITY_DN39865_c0_g1~~TRINITY_DN39865_c0_g1_i1.p1  ORF type:complete len:341 (+),score=22.73 TRINITY_DN39865_c0_g1_i1:82-1104(+)